MGLFDKLKGSAQKQPKTSVPALKPDQVIATRTYVNAKRFKGFRKLHVTVHGDAQAEATCLTLLSGEDVFDCVGSEITMESFKFDNGTGIRVYVNGSKVGVIWDGYNNGPVYNAALNGDIDSVFVRIEAKNIYDGKDFTTEGKASLFVKMPE